MPQTMHSKSIIIGSGPAGLTAAIYAARAALHPVLIRGMEPGGQMTTTTDVENYPGFADVIQGPWLMEQMHHQAEHVGTRLVEDLVTAVDLSRRPFVCVGDAGARYAGDTLIVASGAQARWLGLPGEQRYRGYGVSACATCDGFFFRGKNVVVVGGGNTAVEEAIFLTHHAARVTLVHRRDRLRAEQILQGRLFANPKIAVIWDHIVDDVVGSQAPLGVTGIRLRHVRSGAVQVFACDGVFVAIGHDPASALFRGQLELDGGGYILTRPGSTATSVPGVFAAGDVQDKVFRQAVTAAGSGCMAALEAERFLQAADPVSAEAE